MKAAPTALVLDGLARGGTLVVVGVVQKFVVLPVGPTPEKSHQLTQDVTIFRKATNIA